VDHRAGQQKAGSAGGQRRGSRLSAVVPWVHPDQSEPITPVLPMGSLQNLHRSLIIDGEPVAAGIQPVGDALCHTNPTFAYGAVLSIQHGGSPIWMIRCRTCVARWSTAAGPCCAAAC
jgi:hypothetical protein